MLVGAGTKTAERDHLLGDGDPARSILVQTGSRAARDSVWAALSAGFGDFIEWSEQAPKRIRARLQRWYEVDAILASSCVREHLVVGSARHRSTLRGIIEVAAFTTDSVLVLGETGTGKELVARLIHLLDRRKDRGEFVTVDATTLSPELAASELFGHERGAFTGALTTRDGACAAASQGTLFLDEVGDLPMPVQGQFLRVLQEGTYKRVGGNTWMSTKFRLVAATHRDISGELESGRFRSDLYHRISRWVFRIPPLRERSEEIPALAEHFISEHFGRRVAIDDDLRAFLLRRTWIGNVRELRNLVGRLCGRYPGTGPITLADLCETDRALAPRPAAKDGIESAAAVATSLGLGLREILRLCRDSAIASALRETEGNVPRAARALGITDRALQLELAKRNGAAAE